MKKLMLAVAALATFTLSSCATPWDPSTKDAALRVVAEMEQNGTVTPAQALALRETIEDAADGFTWNDLLGLLGEIGAAALLAFLGVQRVRGPSKPMSPIEAEALRQLAQARVTEAVAAKKGKA